MPDGGGRGDRVLDDHEARIRALERGQGNLTVSVERHLARSEEIWKAQQQTTARLEQLIGKVVAELGATSKKLWMILGACSLAAASTGVVTWALSR